MISILFAGGLPAETYSAFRHHSMVRVRPLSTLVMALTIGAYVMFTAGRAIVTRSFEPFALGLIFVFVLGAVTWFASRTKSVGAFGKVGVLYIVVLQVGALVNTMGSANPLLWLLPTALIVPMCAAPFWITRSHFFAGTLASFVVTIPATAWCSLSREESIVALMWVAIGVCSATTFHLLFYAHRVQHYILERRLADLAATDPLTGVPNRRGFYERAQAVLRDCENKGEVASAVFVDIDHFKSINDSFGHAVGDQVLKGVAKVLVSHTRPDDLVGRLGGEEFAVLITTSPLELAIEMAERLRVAIGAISRPDGQLSASFGVAHHVRGEPLSALLERADEAMFDAKRLGRNRVIVAGTTALSKKERTSPIGLTQLSR